MSEATSARAATWEPVCGLASAAAPTRVVLVRHGETDWNRRGMFQGARDVPLSPAGRAQARALARQLAPLPLDALYTSPLARARETAELVLAARPLPTPARPMPRLSLRLVPALGEFGYGAWEGLSPEERRARFPELDARWAADPWSVALPGGESLGALATRVIPAWDALLAAHAGETIAVVAHGHVNRVILLHVRDLPRAAFWSIAQPNASALLLECRPERARSTPPFATSIAPAA